MEGRSGLPAWVRAIRIRCVSLLWAATAAGIPGVLWAQDPQAGAKDQFPAGSERRDAAGDPLPPGAWERLGTARLRHGSGGSVAAIFSPDSKVLATGADDENSSSIRLWDVATGRELRRIEVTMRDSGSFASLGPSLAFSPDGKIVAGAAVRIQLWEAATGKLLRNLEKDGEWCIALCFSPNGKILAAGDGRNQIRLFDVETGQELRSLKRDIRNQLPFFPMVFSPDGETLATGGVDSKIHLADVSTGNERLCLLGHRDRVHTLAYSPDGKKIASGSQDGTVRLWDPEAGGELRTLVGFRKEGRPTLAFSPEGETLWTGDSDGIRLYDTVSGRELRRREGPAKPRSRVVFAPDGKTLARLSGSAISFWDASSGQALSPTAGAEYPVHFLDFTSDGRTLLAGGAWTQRFWDVASGKELGCFEDHVAGRLQLPISGKIVAVPTWDDIALRKVPEGTELFRFKNRPRGEVAVALSSDGKSLAWGIMHGFPGAKEDTTIHLLETGTSKEVHALVGHSGPIGVLAFAQDGKTLASASAGYGGDNTIRFWDVATGSELWKLEARETPPSGQPLMGGVSFSSDLGVLVYADPPSAISKPEILTLREAATGREMARLESSGERGFAVVRFSPDGRFLAGSEGKMFSPGAGPPSPGDAGKIRLWETGTGKQVASFQGHQGSVEALAFSPEGRFLASGGRDTTVLLWDLTIQGREASRPEEFPQLWERLAGLDAAEAYRSLWRLVASGDAVVEPLLERLKPGRTDVAQVRQWILDLASPSLGTGLKASKMLKEALDQAGTRAELEKALGADPTQELRSRLEALLSAPPNPLPANSPEMLQKSRALGVLERMGTPKAREALRALASGEPSRLSREARSGLARLEAREGAK
ncbi:MAG TPA: WD40 repeat domain-containing protein [Planctomycetota bacterium]|nr:WD40 repeat domain-containing protein [Planctomycetota bacterium]